MEVIKLYALFIYGGEPDSDYDSNYSQLVAVFRSRRRAARAGRRITEYMRNGKAEKDYLRLLDELFPVLPPKEEPPQYMFDAYGLAIKHKTFKGTKIKYIELDEFPHSAILSI